MKATFLYGAGDVRVETVPDPAIRFPTDAIVRTVRACVCGSDLHRYHSMPASTTPRSMGHELIAVVEEVGPEVTTVRPGDFVVAPFAWQDNTCAFCREGMQTACLHGGFYGTPEAAGLQAEFARIPQADGSLVVVPDVDPDAADESLLNSLLALSDVYLTGYHAAHMGRVGPGTTITVIGDGAVGLSAVLASRTLGAERIILMGRHETRTDLGREFGATDVVAARGEEGIEAVRELTDGDGCHVVLEAVGHLPAYEQALGVVRDGGRIARVGVPQYTDGPIGRVQFNRNVTITGGVAPVRAYIDRLLPGILDGTVPAGRVFDVELPLDEAATGYELMDRREALKVMLRP